jgi:hypothetical protein
MAAVNFANPIAAIDRLGYKNRIHDIIEKVYRANYAKMVLAGTIQNFNSPYFKAMIGRLDINN